MEFDTKRYMEVMEDFLNKMQKVKGRDIPKIGEAIIKICSFLRIARVIIVPLNSEGYIQDSAAETVLYEQGQADQNRFLMIRRKLIGGLTSEYRCYQRISEEDWSETEEEKINLFLRMLYTFGSREKAMDIEAYMTPKESGMEIFNLQYYIKFCNQLIDSKIIGDYAACYYNLKSFASINRLVGRDNGTTVMKLFSHGLVDVIGETGTVCRLGGDNFVCVFKKELLDSVQEYLAGTEIDWQGNGEDKVFVTATAGIYLIENPENISETAVIMDNILIACNIARHAMKCPVVFYDESLMIQLKESKQIENMFGTAIEEEEFKVYYQPKVGLKDYCLVGAEALCRWIHKDKIMQPYKFIPILEQSKMICDLDFYMLEHVCRDIRQWMDEGKKVVKVSVNLSRRHLENRNLLDNIITIIDRYEVPHQFIEIELTETTTDVDFTDLKRIVCGLQEAGISTSVDDFGIGYSSLNLIRELPWNVLKLDKSFLSENDRTQAQNHAMLKHIISMAQDMGMECIVEGVETSRHVRLLKENNCFLAQGFYFDKPLPKIEFEEKLQ